ncbi:MAG: HAD family hydrolase [Nitrospiraceae bacterium]
MTRSVLFDFDGTLIDTWRLYLESFRRSLEPHFNRLLTDAEILAYQPSAERRLFSRVIENGNVGGYFESFLAHYRALHETHNEGLYPGVRDMLGSLRAQGCRLGIVTGKSRAAWNLTFAATGLPAFDVVITDDDVAHPKPHPEGLLAALQTVPATPDDTLYVGDSLLDCQAAHAAGMPFGAALWAKTAHEQEIFRAAADQVAVAGYFAHPSMIPAALHAHLRQEGCRSGATHA